MSDKTTAVTAKSSKTKELTLIGLMAAVMCIMGPFSIPLPFSPVPISLTNFAIYLAVYVLGMKRGTISFLVYLALGAVGLPVFSSFSGGLAKLAGPTGGYLIGFIFLALIQGFLMEKFEYKTAYTVLGMVLGTLVCYAFGTVWLAGQLNLTFTAALGVGVIPYLPGDTVKIILAAIIGPKLRAAVKRV